MNTCVSYMYRDADNYKEFDRVVFAGAPTVELVDRLTAALDGGERFIAGQVGVSEVFFGGVYADDPCWHEFVDATETVVEPTDERTFAGFVADVEAASTSGWVSFDRVEAAVGRPSLDALRAVCVDDDERAVLDRIIGRLAH